MSKLDLAKSLSESADYHQGAAEALDNFAELAEHNSKYAEEFGGRYSVATWIDVKAAAQMRAKYHRREAEDQSLKAKAIFTGLVFVEPAMKKLSNLWHNCVAHPLAGVCWFVGLEKLGDWIHGK
jgi:hypothetical protein